MDTTIGHVCIRLLFYYNVTLLNTFLESHKHNTDILISFNHTTTAANRCTAEYKIPNIYIFVNIYILMLFPSSPSVPVVPTVSQWSRCYRESGDWFGWVESLSLETGVLLNEGGEGVEGLPYQPCLHPLHTCVVVQVGLQQYRPCKSRTRKRSWGQEVHLLHVNI